MTGWFAFVPHAEVEARLEAGWEIAGDLGPVHGHWSVLMRWTGEGEPGPADPLAAEMAAPRLPGAV